MADTMTRVPDASHSGTFRIDGVRPVVRLGFGAMRLSGPGIWGHLAITTKPFACYAGR